jgi:cytochrome c oxidase cbb3-type subunit 1
LSAVASSLLIVAIAAIALILIKTVCGADVHCKGGPFCYIKFGTTAFLLSAAMLVASACPQISRVVEFTWFSPAREQLQILGFFVIVMCGAVYELLPGVMGFDLPFPKFVRLQHWFFMLGVVLLVGSLAVGGVDQGFFALDSKKSASDILAASLPFLRASTAGLILLLLGSLLFAANIFVMTFKWKLALLKSLFTAVTAPLETSEVKP